MAVAEQIERENELKEELLARLDIEHDIDTLRELFLLLEKNRRADAENCRKRKKTDWNEVAWSKRMGVVFPTINYVKRLPDASGETNRVLGRQCLERLYRHLELL